MNRAIELATKAIGQTSPNPCVGCVIVSLNGTIVGEGYHERAGLPHAEVGAIKQAGELARDGTAYVSLEPCNHYGRTPPCTLALIKCGIKRVIAGIVDPDPRVSGKGLAFLASQGVEIGIGLQERYKDLFIESTKFQRAIVSKINYDTDITSEYISNDFCNDVIENDTGVQSESTITSNATVNNKRIVTFSRKLWVYQSKYLSKD
eukprot:gene18597-24324_t